MEYFNHPHLPLHGYSYDGDKASNPQTERSTAKTLREAFEDLVLAKSNLAKAQAEIPSYTAQWSNKDYIRDEEQTLVAASHAFEDALVASIAAKSNG